MDSDDDLDCPLCMEELDIADRNFRPCPCGYQVNRNSKCGMFLTVKKKILRISCIFNFYRFVDFVGIILKRT